MKREGFYSKKRYCADCNTELTGHNRSKRCQKHAHKGKLNGMYKGGKKITIRGYKKILKPNHPNRDKHNYIMEHRLVIEKYLGRYLKLKEVVHHINEFLKDNRLINLLLFKNNVSHSKFHYYAYEYLVKTKQLKKYIKWFEKKNKIKIIGKILEK
jgi:hypothetical protein